MDLSFMKMGRAATFTLQVLAHLTHKSQVLLYKKSRYARTCRDIKKRPGAQGLLKFCIDLLSSVFLVTYKGDDEGVSCWRHVYP